MRRTVYNVCSHSLSLKQLCKIDYLVLDCWEVHGVRQVPQQARDGCIKTIHRHGWNQILVRVWNKFFLLLCSTLQVFKLAMSTCVSVALQFISNEYAVAVANKTVVLLLVLYHIVQKRFYKLWIQYSPFAPNSHANPPLQPVCFLALGAHGKLCFQLRTFCI